ncbi:hypothetical protein [Nocardioides humi]|uniref:Malate synthase N-terminal domain-containing protein n=1 Tax=Nocardioides humi TaxID=449461 RepID=A0ABN2BSA5_9ACTN|nr:hypothetical protein [Nocardioides humi]
MPIELTGPAVPGGDGILTSGALASVAELQRHFGPTRDELRAYAQLLVRTRHRRGAMAVGGMAAFAPLCRDRSLADDFAEFLTVPAYAVVA